MEEEQREVNETGTRGEGDLRSVIEEAVRKSMEAQREQAAPAYKAELVEERRRREQLERRVNELVSENEKSRRQAEETERNATIRDELRRLGVSKVDLGFRAVRDEVFRTDDGRLVARDENGEISLHDYLVKFTEENPELLPARIPGGSGATAPQGIEMSTTLDAIKPGMDPDQLKRVRAEIAEAISQVRRS